MKKFENKFIIYPIITACVSVAILIALNLLYKPVTAKLYIDFTKDLSAKKVSVVYLTDTPKMKVKLKNGTIYETDNPRSDTTKESLLKSGVEVLETSPANKFETIPLATFSISILAILVMIIKSSGIASKSVLSVTSVDVADSQNIEYNFHKVAGNEEAKESVKDIVDFLKNPEKYNKYGARMPKGVILYGDPGTGKTLLAKAVAGEAGVPFFAMSGSDFVQVYVGVGASRIRNLFKKARIHGKAVIFIDEIDAIGKKRESAKMGGSDERDQTLNALLTEMSGFNEKEGIVVMAATNRLDMLDPALLRPGRFDRHIEVTLPDVDAREKILKLHLNNKPIGDLNIKEWAQKTSYFSGAKLESLVNEAAILACKDNSKYINNDHLDKAFSIVLAGHEKINRNSIREIDKKITAYHESGHALISLLVLPNEKISKVTIIPSTKGAGGYTLSIPEDMLYQNKKYLEKRIMVLLGGRVAEEIIFGKEFITTGAYSDLKEVTKITNNMITQYGMGNTLGLLNLDQLGNLNNADQSIIIDECKSLIDSLYNDVKNLLLSHKDTLETLSEELIEKETLYSEDIESIFSKE